MSEEAVRVAVRVRPFNQREKDRNAKLTIQMTGAMTVITNPDDKSDQKKFTFDYSYWSHDGYVEASNGYLDAQPGTRYASQQKVFDDLGQGVLHNALEGFNCSLFAYGQTGSGKSYSMVGYGNNKGIVPMTCNELFRLITDNSDANKRFVVTFSMLEIYNENVRDLLNKDSPKGGLPVRENPNVGFYVQGLKKVPVGSYEEIEKRTEQGTANRTVAATNMNATSSRAHTVITITFEQIIKSDDGENKKSSVMNLVDLAGSERADSTGATGDRLKEGANINKSLSALGNVISALADRSMGKKKVQVPYRDSVLTKLLKNALGGNSKTIMIAALSPADINYDETLSTLRYADRAKKIKNVATVNENPLDKLIRELREENEKLKKSLSGEPLPMATGDMSEAEIEKMRRQLEEEIRAQLMANSDSLQMWESQEAQQEKINAAKAETQSDDNAKIVSDKKRKKVPHLTNLNEDPMLSNIVLHYLDGESTSVGRGDTDPAPTVVLKGLSISKNHAVLVKKGKNVEIKPGTQGAKTKVNGLPLTGPRDLQHKDRILFGSNHLYVFVNPLNTECAKELPREIDWEFAQSEIAQAKGFQTNFGVGLTKEQQIAQEQILELLPMVTEVNAISEELNKHRTFEVVLISAAAQEGIYGTTKTTKVMVKMKNLSNDNTWLWERGKFMNRRYMIQEIYQKFLDGEDVSKISEENDPFWEPPEDVLIGTSNVFLQSLGYCLDFDDKLQVTDYKGLEEGQLFIIVTPCNQHGKALAEEDSFVDDPTDLLGKPFYFKVFVKSVSIKKARFSRGIKVRYRVYHEENFTETNTIRGTLDPEFKHSKVISFPSVTQDHLDFFENGCITFSVYGTQEDSTGDPKYSKMSTKELREMERMSGDALHRRSSVIPNDSGSEVSRIKAELVTMQRKNERLEKKEKRLQRLCEEWSKKSDSDRDFDAFYRAVAALAHSSGSRFKTSAEVISKGSFSELDDCSRCGSPSRWDDSSVFLNGSHSQLLAAQRTMKAVREASHDNSPEKARIVNGEKSPSNSEKQGSSACVMM